MDNYTRPAWMEDDLVKDIPASKLNFLEKVFQQGHGKSQKELMAMLMPLLQEAKKEHLTFTPQEMQAAIAAIRKYSSDKEREQMEQILEKNKKTPSGNS